VGTKLNCNTYFLLHTQICAVAADPSFQRKDGQNETAINAKGFEDGRTGAEWTEIKRRGNRQAVIVHSLLDEGLLNPSSLNS
jgi:hypothetical protein